MPVLSVLCEYFGIGMRQHCAYHPARAAAVKRENGPLINKLAECCEDMGLLWTAALAIVLMQMRSGVRAQSGLRRFEFLFGRPLNTGVGLVNR